MESTQLVVALPHLRPVLAELEKSDSGLCGKPIVSDLLNLALLPLPRADRIVDCLREQCPEPPSSFGPPPGADRPGLDQALWWLRAGFAKRYFGWMPTVGKNRVVGAVQGRQRPDPGVSGAGGEVSHGGGGAPRAMDEPTWAKEHRTQSPSGVTIGLVDSPVLRHEFLTGCWTGPYPGQEDGPVRAEHGHATFIAGLVRRHAPTATLHVHPVLDASGNADVWTVAEQIVRAGRAGADVLNLSFACYTEDGEGPMVLATALERLSSSTVVVAAAGNHGFLEDQKYRPAFPAALPNVIAVGAEGAAFSARGAWINAFLPGTDLESTFLSGPVSVWEDPDGAGPARATRHDEQFQGYARWSGTSFSAALMSAMIAERTIPGRVTAAEAAAELLASGAVPGCED